MVLGVGLDPKPLAFAKADAPWFLCDLREMLRERRRRLEAIGVDDRRSVEVALDLRLPDWARRLVDAGFDSSRPSLVILEGVSMYLARDELEQTLDRVRDLLRHPDSRLWLDYVTDSLIGSESKEVVEFLRSMARLGEPFVTGASSAVELAGAGWQVDHEATAADFDGQDDPVFAAYRFALLAAVPC